MEHLSRGFVDSDLADELDFTRMENLATERTTTGAPSGRPRATSRI